MNREELHRRFENTDAHIGQHLRRLMNLEKHADRLYLENLTWHMMWDCLMGILTKKGILTPGEFDAELTGLQQATARAMQAEADKAKEVVVLK